MVCPIGSLLQVNRQSPNVLPPEELEQEDTVIYVAVVTTLSLVFVFYDVDISEKAGC